MGKSLHSRQDEAQVKILVIDDEAAAIRVLTYLLERSGYQGISTQSAKDAFFLLHETPADLIITDIFIPDINSLEVLTRLKKISRHPHPRHLWRLQYRGQDPLELVQDKGADGTFHKPFKAADFIEPITAALA